VSVWGIVIVWCSSLRLVEVRYLSSRWGVSALRSPSPRFLRSTALGEVHKHATHLPLAPQPKPTSLCLFKSMGDFPGEAPYDNRRVRIHSKMLEEEVPEERLLVAGAYGEGM